MQIQLYLCSGDISSWFVLALASIRAIMAAVWSDLSLEEDLTDLLIVVAVNYFKFSGKVKFASRSSEVAGG